MKIILNENRTIYVNPTLLYQVTAKFEAAFLEYKNLLNGKISTMKAARGMNLAELKHKIRMQDPIIVAAYLPLENLINYEQDRMIQRRMTKEEFTNKVLEFDSHGTTTLMFWIENLEFDNHPLFSSEYQGFYEPQLSYGHNCIAIKFPNGQHATNMPNILTQIKRTVRHELQHLTQSFYAELFGLTHWIGLPKKKIFKNKDIHTSKSGKHEDIPIEVATDVQDEIEEFIDFMRPYIRRLKPYEYKKFVKQQALNFIGIGQGLESSVFKHYLDTNKEIWRWAVGKLLFAIKSM